MEVSTGAAGSEDAGAAGAGATRMPDISVLGEHPLTCNDDEATRKVVSALERHFEAGRVQEVEPASASEDFGLFGAAWGVPSVYWFVGGTEPTVFDAAAKAGAINQLPSNHSPAYAPVIHPTLEAGIIAMLTAAGVWLVAH